MNIHLEPLRLTPEEQRAVLERLMVQCASVQHLEGCDCTLEYPVAIAEAQLHKALWGLAGYLVTHGTPDGWEFGEWLAQKLQDAGVPRP